MQIRVVSLRVACDHAKAHSRQVKGCIFEALQAYAYVHIYRYTYQRNERSPQGVALGSSVQVFGFLVPFLVLVGWVFGYPMDLQFGVFEVFSLLLAVLASASILNAGKSYWISGCVLVCAYGMVATGYGVHKEDLDGQCY